MTDDEINAALRPSLAIQWACDEDMVRVPNSARIAYRAGMLRAVEIARDAAANCFHADQRGCWLAANLIERKAAE